MSVTYSINFLTFLKGSYVYVTKYDNKGLYVELV